MTVKKKVVDKNDEAIELRPQARNANKHTAYGLRLLEKSIQTDGYIDAQTAAADGEIISGSARLEVAAEKFTDEETGEAVEPIIVHSDGKRPVIVIRDDIPNADHPRARRLSVAANQIAKVDFDPDGALLSEWGGEDEAIKKMFADDEWAKITGEEPATVDAANENIPEQFMILITNKTEQEQSEMLERFMAEGLQCRALLS
jgi:hypothetical protein